jgi:squalene synthase HpnC
MVKKNTLTKLTPIVRNAYEECHHISKSYYENFPIASFLLPKHLRRSIAAIYAFARTGDDIADEGDMDHEVRLELMTKFETKLYNIQYGKPPTEPIFIALKHTIECFNLPIQLFYDLLAAFRQDILKNRYQNFNEIKDYCHYAANPVGRILLHLAGQASRENLLLSDNICTGLQLTNCIQDITVDLTTKNRCYIPLDEIHKYNINLSDIKQSIDSPNYRNLVNAYITYATTIYEQGMELGQNLPGVFGIEIRFIIACGHKVLQKLAIRDDVFQRPTLTKKDMLFLFFKTLCKRNHKHRLKKALEQA